MAERDVRVPEPALVERRRPGTRQLLPQGRMVYKPASRAQLTCA